MCYITIFLHTKHCELLCNTRVKNKFVIPQSIANKELEEPINIKKHLLTQMLRILNFIIIGISLSYPENAQINLKGGKP